MRELLRTLFPAPVALLLIGVVGLGSAHGYPNGPLIHVSDLAPACAGCHSSMSADQVRNLPPDFAGKQVVDAKHYQAILAGAGAYKDLGPADREKLVEDIKLMDANSTVSLSAPSTAARGQNITVTVTVKGGAGPVVGVFLLESNLRYQARPIASDGWMVVGAPKVIGPDGAEQTKWVDSRAEGAKKNLSFVLVYGVKSDLARKSFPESKITWTLRAPLDPGKYTLAAAFSYGTEKASALGAVPQVGGSVLPRGGGAAASGHLKFSPVATITVN
ncbi:MAG: hypothetical protein HY725_06110 [Candidatus Rokubacteria bacterium]|nr:hypothetical protein [Candidatus Rokubacteria bacterium]